MSDHDWCRDVRRDEAVRAAEDAAAVPEIQHRDLPDVVAALTERVAELTKKHNALADLARLDAGWLKANEQRLTAERDAARARVAELEAAPPPRGWLTAEERGSIQWAANLAKESWSYSLAQELENILARSTPPRVKVPTWMHDDVRRCVIAAIRAAGGEVD